MGIHPDIFRAYDIRGIVDASLDQETVYLIGRAFAAEARGQDQGQVAVGGDGRHSTPRLRDALTQGLTEGGCDVTDVGCVPTPLLYYATHVLGTGTGVMITGSHNPAEYNGLKMMIGGRTLAEEAIQALRERIERRDFSTGDGAVDALDLVGHYVDRVAGDIPLHRPLKVAIDCGNGVAGIVAPHLYERMGCEVVGLYTEVDGDFPNHHPDPAEPANLADLVETVQATGADIGLAFDGDADRLGVVTDAGTIVWPDRLMMLFATDLLRRHPGARIVYDVKCTQRLKDVIADHGGEPVMCRTGHSHIKAKLRETGALLGGEFSGHLCFAEGWYGFDDALYAGARLLDIASRAETTVEGLFREFPVTCVTPEIKVNTSESAKFEIVDRLAAAADFGDAAVTTIDGIRVDYPDGFGLVRASNTSPVLSLRFEADTPAALARIRARFQTELASIDTALRFD
ncbi:MAG: phosphomannomutase/phosphoglucomutase [Gammaproteobacteria bacterium]|nr:phosphomannomutase/phosphoglucomutase [Gammaproteobacteria bacterium]